MNVYCRRSESTGFNLVMFCDTLYYIVNKRETKLIRIVQYNQIQLNGFWIVRINER